MLAIRERRNAEQRLIVNVGIAASGVSNKSPKLDTIDRVTDARAGGSDVFGFCSVYSNIPGLN